MSSISLRPLLYKEEDERLYNIRAFMTFQVSSAEFSLISMFYLCSALIISQVCVAPKSLNVFKEVISFAKPVHFLNVAVNVTAGKFP